MQIVGIGVDIVNIKRIENLWLKYRLKFLKRILSINEILILNNVLIANINLNIGKYLSKKFAAKESTSKALGTGFRDDIFLSQIVLKKNNNGKPYIKYSDKTKAYIHKKGYIETYISLSDENDYAVSFAIIFKKY